jgi:hypothetical protein
MSTLPKPPLRDFDDTHRDLERVVGELKRSLHPAERRVLLRELRSLIAEADQFISDEA